MKTIILTLTCIFQLLAAFAQYEDLVPVMGDNGKYGYKDFAAKWVIEPKYKSAEPCYNGLCNVYNDADKYGVINLKGQEIVPFTGSYYSDITKKVIVVLNKSAGLAGAFGNVVYSREGKILIPEGKYEELKQSGHPDFLCARIKGNWGLVNLSGTLLGAMEYDDIQYRGSNLFVVKKSDKFGFINEKGEVAIEIKFGVPPNLSWVGDFINGFSCVATFGTAYYISTQGITKSTKFRYAENFTQNIAIVSEDYYSDEEKFSRNLSFEELARKKHGVIDISFNEIVPLEYDAINVSAEDQLIFAHKNNNTTYLNFKGEKISSPVSGSDVKTKELGLFLVKKDKNYGYVDKSGKAIIPPIFSSIKPLDDSKDLFVYTKEGSDAKGFMTTSGTVLFEPMFTFVDKCKGNLIFCRSGSLAGYVTTKGNFFLKEPKDYAIDKEINTWLYEKKQPKTALGIAEAATLANPKNTRAHFLKGELFKSLGDTEKAYASYVKSGEAEGNKYSAVFAVIELSLKANDFKGALPYAEKLAVENTVEGNYYFGICHNYMSGGNPFTAETHLKKAYEQSTTPQQKAAAAREYGTAKHKVMEKNKILYSPETIQKMSGEICQLYLEAKNGGAMSAEDYKKIGCQ